MTKNIFKYGWKRMVIALAYGIIIMIIYNLLNKGWSNVIAYSNGSFIAGFTLVCIWGLNLVSKAGGFDIFGYMFGAKKDPTGRKETLYDYSERKKVSRSSKKYTSIPFLLIGIIYIIISFALLLIFESVA